MSEPQSTNSETEGAVRLDPVIDAMVESMIVINEDGVMERVNKATQKMFGYMPDELLGKNIRMLMAGSDRIRHDDYMHRYKQTGVRRIIGIGREVLALRKDGSNFPANIAVGEVNGPEGRRFVGLVRDLTDQRELEEQALRRREEMVNVSRLSTMGEMAAAMAHELNQPLTAIANYGAACIRLLEHDPIGNQEDIREALQEITNQAHRAGEVIRRTRSFTRSTDSEREETTLSKVAAQIRSLAELDTKANNIRLNWDIPEELLPILVDPIQIQQVILNLIRNAVDAMQNTTPDERTIDVSAKLTGPHELRLEVRDHGIGVDESAAPEIFNAFYTTKSTGMGMGLAICRTIILAHGGTLRFRKNDKRPGDTGSTFFFTIPTKVSN
jgi:two-component system sensor kinase FixL